MGIRAKYRRWRFKRAMLRAIRKARTDIWVGPDESMTCGLRVIKRFERVNRRRFDPFNKDHVFLISGNGSFEAHFRESNIFFQDFASRPVNKPRRTY